MPNSPHATTKQNSTKEKPAASTTDNLRAQSSAQALIIAGEASGDNLGQKLIQSMRQQQTAWHIAVMGDQKMQAAADQVLVDSQHLAIIGFWEALLKWREVRRALRTIKSYLLKKKPQLVILIDYPGFNLHVAKYAKAAGAKVLFYVSPQIWAWRFGRIHKIKQRVDHMAVLFSFEKKIYEAHHIPVTWVGHSMLEWVKVSANREQTRHKHQFDPDKPLFCLLPGSRKIEIKHHLALIARCAQIIKQSIPQAQFAMPLAASLHAQKTSIQAQLPRYVKLCTTDHYNLIAASDVAMCASGTVTLEVSLLKTPLVIFYKVNWLSYLLIRLLIQTPWVAISNIIMQQEVIKEYLQHQAQASAIANEAIKLLENNEYRQHMLHQLEQIKQQLQHGKLSPADQVANLAQTLLDKS